MTTDKSETKDSKIELSILLELAEKFRQANAYLDGSDGLLQDRPTMAVLTFGIPPDVKKDPPKAVELYRLLAEQAEYAPAQFKLGDCYYMGHGVKKNPQLAFYWYEKAARRGLVSALLMVGDCYAIGYGIEKDEKMAEDYYIQAVKQGDWEATLALEVLPEKGDGKGDIKETKVESPASPTLIELAQQFAKAHHYLNGDDANQRKAIKLYEELALDGYALAQFKMGECYEHGGGGVQKNMLEAMLWYQMAAEQGHPPAKFKLGQFYERGWGGVQKNIITAMHWYCMLAEGGDSLAQFKVGEFYEHGGGGIEANKKEAMRWYRKAAEQEYPPAQLKVNNDHTPTHQEPKEERGETKAEANAEDAKPLSKDEERMQLIEAEHCLFGIEGPQDRKKAAELLQTLAEKSIGAAQFMLGYCYQQGWGVNPNNYKAVILYHMAAKNGDLNTKKNVAEVLWTLEGPMITCSPIFKRMQTAITKDVIFVGEHHPRNDELDEGMFTPARRAVMALINSNSVHTLSVELGTPSKNSMLTTPKGKVVYELHKEIKQKGDRKSFPQEVRRFVDNPLSDETLSALEKRFKLRSGIDATAGPADQKQAGELKKRMQKTNELLTDFVTICFTPIDTWQDVLSAASKENVAIYFHDQPIEKPLQKQLLKELRWPQWESSLGHIEKNLANDAIAPPYVHRRNQYSTRFLKEHGLLGPTVLVLGGADHFKNLPEEGPVVAEALHILCGKNETNVFDLSDKKLLFGPQVDFPIADLEAAIKIAISQTGAGRFSIFAPVSGREGIIEQNKNGFGLE